MTAKLTEGGAAPDFNLPATGSRTVSLNSLKGRKIILFFYPKDDTTGCTKEALDFSALIPEFSKAGAEVLGVSPDSLKAHGKFSAKHGLNVTLLSDENREVLEAYGVWVEKSMYGRKYMGVERTTVLIDSKGKIARVWNKVKVPGHAEDVLKTIKIL